MKLCTLVAVIDVSITTSLLSLLLSSRFFTVNSCQERRFLIYLIFLISCPVETSFIIPYVSLFSFCQCPSRFSHHSRHPGIQPDNRRIYTLLIASNLFFGSLPRNPRSTCLVTLFWKNLSVLALFPAEVFSTAGALLRKEDDSSITISLFPHLYVLNRKRDTLTHVLTHEVFSYLIPSIRFNSFFCAWAVISLFS